MQSMKSFHDHGMTPSACYTSGNSPAASLTARCIADERTP